MGSLQCIYNIKKNLETELIFCMQINIKVSYKVILQVFTGLIKYSHSTQCNRFAIS